MPYNIHAGFGQQIANSMGTKPHTGQWFAVATSTLAGWDEINEIFNSATGRGVTRVYTTLRELLDSGNIVDGNDDVIFVMPGHTETVNSAGQLDTGTSAAGLSIVGLGEGDERPLFTFQTATTADFDIGSNGVTVENIRWDLTGVDALVAPFDVNDSGFTFRNNDVLIADSAGQCVNALVTDANADKMVLEGNNFHGTEDAGCTSAIRIVGGDDITIKDNYIVGHFKITAGGIENTTTAVGTTGYCRIEDNIIANRTASSTRAINFVEASRADVVNNRLHIMSLTSPVSIAESSTSGLGGLIFVSGNYFQSGTSIGAGTLL